MKGRYVYIMPIHAAYELFIKGNGISIICSFISKLLITPQGLRSIIQAYTRINEEVQNGNITSISKISRIFSLDRAMAYAIGNPSSKQHPVEVIAISMDVAKPWIYISSVNRVT